MKRLYWLLGFVILLFNNLIAQNPTCFPQQAIAKPKNAPKWFEGNRIHYHARLRMREIEQNNLARIDSVLKLLNAKVAVRHVKTGDETPYWALAQKPEKLKNWNPLDAYKTFEQSQTAHTIAYYRHMEEAGIAVRHPEWRVLDLLGNPVKSKRGEMLCFNTPYSDTVINRILYLNRHFGYKVFYFDELHIDPKGCYCKFCSEKCTKQYGENLRVKSMGFDSAFAYKIRNQTIYEFFDRLQKSLHKQDSEATFVVSGNNFPALSDLHMSEAFFSKFPLKTEMAIPVRATARGSLRLTQNARKYWDPRAYYLFAFSYVKNLSPLSPHVWIPNTEGLNETEACVGGILALGGIANLDINPFVEKNAIQIANSLKPLEQAFAFMSNARVYSEFDFVYDESAKQNNLGRPGAYWQKYMRPLLNNHQFALQHGLAWAVKGRMAYQNLANGGKPIKYEIKKQKISEWAKSQNARFFCSQKSEGIYIQYYVSNGDYYAVVFRDFFDQIHIRENMLNKPEAKPLPKPIKTRFLLHIAHCPSTTVKIETLYGKNAVFQGMNQGYNEFSIELLENQQLAVFKIEMLPNSMRTKN